jgi:hypothetical protein
MKKLPVFNATQHEFTHFAITTMKNTMAIQAIENHLNLIVEAINELTDKNSNVDLETFKATFLKELATLLNQSDEFEFSDSLFELLGAERTDLKNSFSSLELQFQALAERVSQIESVVEPERFEKRNISDLLT